MPQADDGLSHQLIIHYDPDRIEWCMAECTCRRWSYETTAVSDPKTHILQSSVEGQLEWLRHLPPGQHRDWLHRYLTSE
jgi:hypothetical protein